MSTKNSQASALAEVENPLLRPVSEIAAAMADPSRVSMLCALMDGRAWTATELSVVAGIAPSTASAHLARLQQNRLISCLSQGRHRYYRLSGEEVAAVLESLMGLSVNPQKTASVRTPAHLRHARTCYDHLAGEVAVAIYDVMLAEQWILPESECLSLPGKEKFLLMGISDIPKLRRKAACACLDWSERRFHLGGNAGAQLLTIMLQNQWITRQPGYREVTFTPQGKRAVKRFFGVTM
ncbi:ArsR/SmtB family transcription factor [Tatumella sp. UBA2305]|uniref:ArsR/SmtB family transcription factor n=1 Tax=Tatumella sp. UBA2305 TaxID=1947647 RepID=UPI0025FA3006|nr:metalloregulator ArsR/SmtB family transcription factor [Tatumella sp. UBA2305]